ncbi:MAG: hypothetical protein J5I50_06155 [Chitinophagaceae bacterium]|nr:hypothetical protein [Chitinophagaceae bacterium]
MESIILGSLILSLLHATIPNHWLPIIAIGRKQGWTLSEVRSVTFLSAVAHGVSTVLIGLVLYFIGSEMAGRIEYFARWIGPGILILLGLIFIYRHHVHLHFHVNEKKLENISKGKIILGLTLAMFFSPCLEIEGYFLMAGTQGPWLVWFIAGLYLVITITGMLILVQMAYKGLLKLDWHKLEHNAGIITGLTLVVTGIISIFIH